MPTDGQRFTFNPSDYDWPACKDLSGKGTVVRTVKDGVVVSELAGAAS